MKTIRHTGIVVSNMTQSLKFYRDLLKMKVVKNFKEQGNYINTILNLNKVKLWMIKLIADDGSMIELLEFSSSKAKKTNSSTINNVGCSHISITVDDIDKEYNYLKKNGVEFNSLPCISSDGYAKVAFCKDPDGFFIELVEVL